jgi:hypothetical protein
MPTVGSKCDLTRRSCIQSRWRTLTWWCAVSRRRTWRWVRPVRADLTRSVNNQALGELSGTNLTCGLLRWSARPVDGRNTQANEDLTRARRVWSSSAVSDHHLNMREEASWPLESWGRHWTRWHVAAFGGPDASLGASDRPDQRVRSLHSRPQWEPNGSIRGGSLFKPYGQLKLTLLAISIDIAALWA